MTTPGIRHVWQAPGATDQSPCQATLLAASRLAQIARDQFWAARRSGDRAAMIHWSVREIVLRRRAHGLTALGALPARIRARA